MKFIKYIISIIAISGLLTSCSNEDDNGNELVSSSASRLLPSATTETYSTDVYGDERDHVTISTRYTYNESNQFSETSVKSERRTLSATTTNTIFTYDTNGNITHTQTTQTGGEQNDAKTHDRDYIHSGNEIKIIEKGETIGIIQLNAVGQVAKYIWYDSEKNPVTQSYSYDKQGNLIQYTYVSNSHTQSEKYTTDNKNGIFKCVATPQWYLVINYYNSGYFNNPATASSSVNGSNFEIFRNFQYKYNRDFYPVQKISSLAPGWIGGSDTSLNIEYIRPNS